MTKRLSLILALAVGVVVGIGINRLENRQAVSPVGLEETPTTEIADPLETVKPTSSPPPELAALAEALRLTSDPVAFPTANPAAIQSGTFTIEKIETLPEEKTLIITFSEEVEMDELRNRGEIEPYTSLHWWGSSMQGKTLRLNGEFDYDKDYVLSFSNNLTSRNNKIYQQTVGEFHMPDRPQNLGFSEDKTLIERNSRQMVHLDVVNIDEIQFEGLQIPPLTLPMARSLVEGSTPESLEMVSKGVEQEYTRLAEALSSSEEFSPFLREPVADKNLFLSPTEKNIKKPFSIPLTFRKNPEKGTLELLQFRNNASDGTGETKARLYRITDLGLMYKLSGDQLLVWVTSLEKGEPKGDVSLLAFDKDLNAYSLGRTSAEGLLLVKKEDTATRASLGSSSKEIRIDRSPLPFQDLTTLVAATQDDVNTLDFEVEESVKVAGIEQAASRTFVANTDLGNLFTDRGVYRPGETMHWKGTVRSYDMGSIVVPEEATCEVEIKDSRGNTAYQENLEYSAFGTVYDELDIDTFAPLGTYTMYLRPSSGEVETALRSFQVQEYRPPRHYVEVQFRSETRVSNVYVNRAQVENILVAKLSSRYYAGGPLKNAKVRWTVASTPTDFPQESYPNFVFGYPMNQEGELIESSESILNESGEVEVRMPLGKSILASKYGLLLTATVIDFDGRTATKSGDYSVRPKYLVGLSSHADDIQFGDPQILRALVLDASGNRIESGELAIKVMERSYHYTRKRNRDGNVYTTYDSVWKNQYATNIPIREGEANFDFSFNDSGEYLVECTHRTETGEEFTSGSIYQVSGPWYWSDDFEEATFQPVQILPDKPEYSVGENIRLLVNSNYRPSACILAIERENVLEHRFIRLEDGEIVLPITDGFRPNVFISILGVVPRGDFPTYEQEYDSEAPSFVYGVASVKVRNEVGRLDIVIAPDTKDLRAQPGDTVDLDLLVKDESGNPTVAEVAVAVVDEQVLALTGYTTPSLKNLLDFKLPLSVFTGETRQALQNQTPYDEIQNRPLTGGDGGLLGYGLGLQLREDFSPVAYFNPALLTDAEGRARFSFEFPDTMTKYRIFAVACDKAGRFGSAERSAVVVKNFYLEPGTPKFFTRGDEFQFKISLFNHTDQAGPVEVDIDTSDHLSLELLTPSPFLEANDQIQIPVSGKALRSGSAQLTVAGRFGQEEDAVRIEIPVESGLLIHKDVQYGTFSQMASIAYSFPKESRDIPWRDVSPEDFHGTLTLSGSPFLRLGPSLRYLLEYPYGCIEQTSSGALPLAALRSLIEKGLVPGFAVEEVDPFLEKGIERIFSMQTDSGGFAYWPDLRKPDAWGTLYAVTALMFAREAGFEIPEKPLTRALAYLEGQLGTHQPDQGRNLDYRSMAKYLLAKAEHLEAQHTQDFDREYEELARESRFLSLMTAKILDLQSLENLQSRMATLLSQTEMLQSNLVFNAVYRGTAVSLLAGQLLEANAAVQKRLADQLITAMKPSGGWTSTSDTGWSLLALGKYFSNLDLPNLEVSGHVSLPGGESEEFRFDPKAAQTFSLNPQTFLATPKIEVVADANFPLSYQLEWTYPRLDFAKEGYSHGFKIQKTIENVGNTEAIHVGDVVKVTIRFEPTEEGELHHLALDDPLPAGLVAINSALANEEPVDKAATSEDDYAGYWDEGGYYRFLPNHSEMRDTRVVAFRDRIWSGAYQYSYYARTVCAGTFRVAPTKVQLIYSPDVCAYTPESSLVIEE